MTNDERVKAAATGTPQATGPSTLGFNALKFDRLFVVFSDTGEILGPGTDDAGITREGVFIDDMRVLSRLRILIAGQPPSFMRGSVDRLNTSYETLMSNATFDAPGGVKVPAQSLTLTHLRRVDDGVNDRLVLRNFTDRFIVVPLEIEVHSDFRDIFEIRGVPRPQRGRDYPAHVDGRSIVLRHEAPDGVRMETRLVFDRPIGWRDGVVEMSVDLEPGGETELEWHIVVTRDASRRLHKDRGSRRISGVAEARFARLAVIQTDNPTINRWFDRSAADLSMLLTDGREGLYPYAGLPWFSTQFGRDGIVTALQTMWCDPSIARGVLGFLCARQADETDPTREAEPGKILHEVRHGEMARLGLTPYALYYGGVDQTLLYVILAERYLTRTADAEFVRALLPSIDRALAWARDRAGMDLNGFVSHPTDSPTGLRNQGWKDSENAIFHETGELAKGPIALIEVQAYHVAALRAGARLHRHFGHVDLADAMHSDASHLVDRIDRVFWMEDRNLWAMALDGNGRQVRTLSSNAAHVLFAEAGHPNRIAAALDTLSSAKMRSGFGLRTVSTEAALYNPMGYHVGSVWPHDTSIAAAGAAKAGRMSFAVMLFDDLFAAAQCFPDMRLPELFCGFDRREVACAAPYLSACAPQAWAAGAPFLMLEALLGIEVDALARRISFAQTALPTGVDLLKIRRLPMGGRSIDLNVRRSGVSSTLEVVSAPQDVSFSFRT